MKSDSISFTQYGFSLVETIAAMGILSLAAIPLLELANESISSTKNIQQRFFARTVAENVLVNEVLASTTTLEDVAITMGVSTQMSRSFAWTVTRLPAGRLEPQIVNVEVRLENGTEVLSRVSGLSAPDLPNLAFGDETSDVSDETSGSSAVDQGIRGDEEQE